MVRVVAIYAYNFGDYHQDFARYKPGAAADACRCRFFSSPWRHRRHSASVSRARAESSSRTDSSSTYKLRASVSPLPPPRFQGGD